VTQCFGPAVHGIGDRVTLRLPENAFLRRTADLLGNRLAANDFNQAVDEKGHPAFHRWTGAGSRTQEIHFPLLTIGVLRELFKRKPESSFGLLNSLKMNELTID
jgi:hypothetical protein